MVTAWSLFVGSVRFLKGGGGGGGGTPVTIWIAQ